MPATICMDLDGTILDVWPRYYNVFRSFWCNQPGFTLPDVAEYRRLKMMLVQDNCIVRHLAQNSLLDAAAEREYRVHKQQMLEREDMLSLDTVFGRFHDFAVQVKKTGYSLHLVSIRTDHSLARKQLDRLGIRQWMDHIDFVLPSRGENPKWKAMKDKAGGDDIMIGDSETDIACGAALALRTFHVSTGLRRYEYVRRYGPATPLNEYSDLLAHL